jgi:hypothetical protein
MPTMIERQQNTATLLIALGQLDPNATPAERQAAIQALTDAEIDAWTDELLARLGHPDYRQQAAA